MRRLLTFLILSFAALAMPLSAPLSAQVSINTNLTTGTMTTGVANLYRTGYLHFHVQLQCCNHGNKLHQT